MAFIEREVAARPGLSGVYVLETGEEALITRAWLVDHARESIDVQYFIWSTDNIGILAAAALLRAAERGVRVRVIVDALLIDAPPDSLIALARHPRIDIRIYNHQYNFRDRDALLAGDVVKQAQASFARFWDSALSVPAEELFDGVRLQPAAVERIYAELGAYARSPENFAPEVRAAIAASTQ